MNPYIGQDFFHFFLILLRRLLFLEPGPLASDEIQLLVLGGVALSCSLIGTFLILRKMAMLANALSHTILVGIVVGYLLFSTGPLLPFSILMGAALFTGLLTAGLTEGLQRITRLQEDASIGLVFSLLFSLGVILINLYTRNTHLGLELVMGNADALVRSDIKIVWIILTFNVLLLVSFFRGYQITTFDPLMARALGFSPLLYTYLLMVQASLTTISAFRCIGVFMVLALLIVPTLIMRMFIHSLIPLLVGTCVLSVSVVIGGVALSRHLLTYYGIGLSTGGLVVTCLFLLFLLAAVCKLTFSRRAIYYLQNYDEADRVAR